MARFRRPPKRTDVPARLIVFNADDWGADDGDPYRQWSEARLAFYHRVGEPCFELCQPDAKYGDIIDVLNNQHAVRRHWPGPSGA